MADPRGRSLPLDFTPESLEGEPDSGLYIVWKKNPYFKKGTYLYLDDQGFQRVSISPSERHSAPGGTRGLTWRLKRERDSIILGKALLLPFVVKVERPSKIVRGRDV